MKTFWAWVAAHNGIVLGFLVVGYVYGMVSTILLTRPRYCARCGQLNRWLSMEHAVARGLKGDKGDKGERGAKGEHG
jgi:hypothetical protein